MTVTQGGDTAVTAACSSDGGDRHSTEKSPKINFWGATGQISAALQGVPSFNGQIAMKLDVILFWNVSSVQAVKA